MSARMAEARKAAFLKALEETGNQSLAAEAAKVSRSWVCLHRKEHAEFDSAVRAAVAAAKARLGAHPERRPPSGWGFLDGAELVVRGSGGSGGGRRVQIARARLKQWTPRVEDRFLAALSATCNVKAACAAAGMTFSSAYAHRERWPAFARRWDEALELADTSLTFALVHHAANPFSSPDLPPPDPLPPMNGRRFDETLHSLYMHQHRLRGTGGRPGREKAPVSFEESVRRVNAAIDAIEAGDALSEAVRAGAEADYARRRPRAMERDEEELRFRAAPRLRRRRRRCRAPASRGG